MVWPCTRGCSSAHWGQKRVRPHTCGWPRTARSLEQAEQNRDRSHRCASEASTSHLGQNQVLARQEWSIPASTLHSVQKTLFPQTWLGPTSMGHPLRVHAGERQRVDFPHTCPFPVSARQVGQ
jgi:hypothetical protein